MRTPDPPLLTDAAKALAETTGLTVDVPRGERHRQDERIDGQLRLQWNDQTRIYPVEFKGAITNTALGAVADQVNRLGALLITRHVTPPQAHRLRELGAQFVDTAGNAYLNDPPLFVFVTGNRPATPALTGTDDRLYRPAGLKVVFALLCDPLLAAAPMRDIAAAAGVALGTVKHVVDALRAQQHLPPRRKNTAPPPNTPALQHRDRLIRRWVELYPERLQPKLLLGRYAPPAADWWQELDPRQYDAAWGGEVAAFHLTQYLKPATATLYIKGPTNRLLLDHRLRRDNHGTVTVLEQFWNFPTAQVNALVPPLLVYADLLAIGDPRTVEVAGQIHEQWLAHEAT
jgi:hypothetical protein